MKESNRNDRNKKRAMEIKNTFDRLIKNLMQPRKESVNLKRGQQKLYKLKHKEKKKIQELWNNIKCSNLSVIDIPKGEKRLEKEYFKK